MYDLLEDSEETDECAARFPEQQKAFERDVRRKVMTHLSLGNTSDLTAGLVLISIVIDIERIGDYSKNIHDLATVHPDKLHGGSLEDDVGNTGRRVLAHRMPGIDNDLDVQPVVAQQHSAPSLVLLIADKLFRARQPRLRPIRERHAQARHVGSCSELIGDDVGVAAAR